MRKRIGIPVVVLIWFVIGTIAAAQRGYFSESEQGCNTVGTILVTILVGPLNYIGVDPQVNCPEVPEPS